MTINAGSVSEDHSQYVGQIYREHYGRLHHYFMSQLGDAAVADECVDETVRHFFFFMEERQWEEEEQYIFVYLMRIAGLLCSRKLAARRPPRPADLAARTRRGMLEKVRTEAVATVKKQIEFVRSALEAPAMGGGSPSFSEARRA